MYKYYLAYKDSGPSGACGQSCSNTMPWIKLFVFDNEKKAREYIEEILDNKWRRISPKIIGFYSDDPNFNNLVKVDC